MTDQLDIEVLPCTLKDWPEDDCRYWRQKYDQQPCDNCKAKYDLADAPFRDRSRE